MLTPPPPHAKTTPQIYLHGLDSALMVAARVVKLLLLLMQPPIDLSAHIAQLQVHERDLGLLLLQRLLGLLQRRLQLVLLLLQTSPALLQLVHVAAVVTQLRHQVLDLLGQVLVLAAHRLHALLALLVLRLHLEHLGAVLARLPLRHVQLDGDA